MSTLEHTADRVLNVIQTRIGTRTEVRRDSPLFDGGLGLDSIEFLELLLEIEQTCGKRLRDETLTESAVANVGSLIQYVHALERR